MSAIVVARRLARWYGPVIGVNDLDVEIGPGITGLLGPNGAGKSTFLRLVTGLLRPSRGSLEVLGRRPFGNAELHRRLGLCPEHDALYEDMTALDFVLHLLRLHGYGLRAARPRAEAALAEVDLLTVGLRQVRGFSKGMRQRLKIAQAIAHGPEFLVLDEPMTGLDPVMRARMIALFRRLRDRGTHLLVSTHILHEVEALTEKILLIHRGRVLADGTVAEIRRWLEEHPQRVHVRARDARRLAVRLLADSAVQGVQLDDDERGVVVQTARLAAFEAALPAIAAEAQAGIEEFEVLDAGLEAVFDYLVG